MTYLRQVAAIDGGKSGLRLVVRAPRGHISGHGPGFVYPHTVSDIVSSILESVRAARKQLGQPGDIERMCVGLTGLPGDLNGRRSLAAGLALIFPRCEFLLASDAVLAHAGALYGLGVVISAGTGTAVLAVARGGQVASIDGWGPYVGDRGSGYAVGTAGLQAAAAAIDGVGPSTSLVDAMERDFGGTDLASLQRFHGNPARVGVIAGFAREVATAARAGDGVSLAILHQAAADLAATAAAAARRVGLVHDGVPVALAGRLQAAGEVLTEPLRRALAAYGLMLVPAEGDAIDGGLTLAEAQAPTPYEHLLERYPVDGAQC